MHRFPRRPSPAMAVAFIALLAALSGTAVALPGKNTVDSGDIRKGAVKRGDIARNAVNGGKVQNGSLTGADARNDSLTGTDVQESSLGTVPSANAATNAQSATNATNAQNAANADLLDGSDSTGFHRFGGTIPSAQTIRGVLGSGFVATAAGQETTEVTSFPVQAPNDIANGDAHLNGSTDEPAAGTCTGTFANPTAPPGDVCVYSNNSSNSSASTRASAVGGSANPYGFMIVLDSSAAGVVFFTASWAYTAP
jgi:hypothetical protein